MRKKLNSSESLPNSLHKKKDATKQPTVLGSASSLCIILHSHLDLALPSSSSRPVFSSYGVGTHLPRTCATDMARGRAYGDGDWAALLYTTP